MRLSLIVTFIFTNFMFAQLSNKHWIPPLHARQSTSVSDHHLYLSTPEPIPFNVTVRTGAGNQIPGSPFTISQGNPAAIFIGNGQPSSMFLEQSDVNVILNDKGLILEGVNDFYATFKVRNQNHAEILVSKGRPGIGTSFRLGSLPQTVGGNIRNFVSSFMATEDNTEVTVSEYDTEVIFTSGTGDIFDNFQSFTLNRGQSVVLSGYADNNANLEGFVGALLVSDKPIAVNTGNALGGMLSQNDGQDFNLDQIVSYDQIGSEYLVVRGNGPNASEFPLVIATQDNTEIFVNGSTTPITTLNSGDYFKVPSTLYQGVNNQNMYITSSNPIYLYQVLAGGSSGSPNATTGLNFIPPLSCFFQKSVDLIPSINSIGNNTNYITDIIALTYATATVSLNGVATTALPEAVLGNTDWVTYKISGFTGDVIVESTGPLAVGIIGRDNNAVGFSGYYSGFGSEPRDTNTIVCSNGPVNLLEEIDGNPETGGIWTPALSSGTDIFNPNVDLAGTYNYSYTADCANVTVDVTVAIQQAPNTGNNTILNICTNASPIDLITVLGSNITTGGTWSPPLASGTGVFNPAVDISGDYTYTITDQSNICPDISSTVTVNNTAIPTVSSISEYRICDNSVDGNDSNGFVTFNLPTKNMEALNGQNGVNVTYHATLQNAIDNVMPLTNYYSNSQLVYVRLTNSNTNCYATTSFNLVVNPLPVVNTVVDLKQCDTDTDAITDFNLTFANLLISNDTSLNFAFYTSQSNAQNNVSPITNVTNYTSGNNGTVWAVATNSNSCRSRVIRVNLLVSTTTPLSVIPLPECDDYIDSTDPENDGFDYFNLNNATTSILSQFPPNQNLQVSYFENEADATAGLNAIDTSIDFRNTVADNQLLWVRIDSPINNECFGLGEYVQLIVNPIPNLDLGLDFVVCIDAVTGIGSQTINATPTTAGNYSYNWTPTNPTTDSMGNQSAIYSVDQSGTYTVVVTNTITGCNNSDSIEVTFSSEPVSASAVLITPLFSPGTASIEAIPVGGYGIYEYSIDNGLNWQPSPIFAGLVNGNYTILVRDLEQCGLVQTQSIQTVTYPPYFTPNGDGFNDFWNISGLIQSFQASIYIFDRYGKLLKEISPNGNGWDGTFNGQPLPSTDYWFKIEYTENGNRQEFKSHFTLKR